jgi:hypothetical protein
MLNALWQCVQDALTKTGGFGPMSGPDAMVVLLTLRIGCTIGSAWMGGTMGSSCSGGTVCGTYT